MVVSHSPFTAITVQAREFALKVCGKNIHIMRDYCLTHPHQLHYLYIHY